MDRVHINILQVSNTLANGDKIKRRAMEGLNGQMEIYKRVNIEGVS